MPRMLPFYAARHVEMLNLSVSYLKDSPDPSMDIMGIARQTTFLPQKNKRTEIMAQEKLIQISAAMPDTL